MSFQAYLDNVKAKTGKTPEDFAKLATRLDLAKHGEIVKWLKSEHSLGHGQPNNERLENLKRLSECRR